MALNETKKEEKIDVHSLFGMTTGTEEDYMDLSDYKKYYLSDLKNGQSFSGEASIKLESEVLDDNDKPRKWSRIIFNIFDDYSEPQLDEMDKPIVGETLGVFINCPKFKEDGKCKRISKPSADFDFYRNAWNFITGVMGIVEPNSLIDPKTGEEINVIKKIDLTLLSEFLNGKHVTVEKVDVENSQYPTFKINMIQDI